MIQKIIELRIDRIAGLGDGVGEYQGGKVFVPYTVAGDVVRARIVRQISDAVHATLEQVITPGAGRVTPPCRHFTRCGGCALQHMEHALYYDFKQKMAEEAVRKAGFGTDCVKAIVTFPADSRRRVDLKVKNGAIGFHAGRSHTIVDMEECKVMEPALFDVVMRIKNQLSGLPDVTALQINGVDNGYDIAVDGKGDISVDVPEIRRLSVREGAGFRTVCRKGAVTLALGDITVDVPPGAFLQASHAAQVWMTHLVIEAVKTAGNVLDLFAGIGTYAFPVSESASVTAVEGDKAMVEAMRDAAKKHVPGRKFRAQRRDLFSSPLDAGELAGFEAVIINPPRAGAKAQAMQLAVSRVKKIVMVSCNPATFTRDARILREGGYRLHDVIPVDQFAYSPHLELVAEFMRG